MFAIILVREAHVWGRQLSYQPLGGDDPAVYNLGVAVLLVYILHHFLFQVAETIALRS